VSQDWKLVFDETPFEFFLSLKAPQRRILLAAFSHLKSNPSAEADHEAFDDCGRSPSVKGFRPFLVTYWLNHSAKEIRVLDIQLIDY
jgi:hypothetical protein